VPALFFDSLRLKPLTWWWRPRRVAQGKKIGPALQMLEKGLSLQHLITEKDPVNEGLAG